MKAVAIKKRNYPAFWPSSAAQLSADAGTWQCGRMYSRWRKVKLLSIGLLHEKVDLDGSGGAHITPMGFATSSGGDTHQTFDMRGSVVTEDLMRRAEGAAAIHASEHRMMSAMPAMQREINLRRRS
jgi:hypothetical protein